MAYDSVTGTHGVYNEIWIEVFIESSHTEQMLKNVPDSVATFWPWYLSVPLYYNETKILYYSNYDLLFHCKSLILTVIILNYY